MKEWFWPQYLYLTLFVINFLFYTYKATHAKDAIDAVCSLVAHYVVGAFLLYVLYRGGFF